MINFEDLERAEQMQLEYPDQLELKQVYSADLTKMMMIVSDLHYMKIIHDQINYPQWSSQISDF